jgi:hypothetical protein
LFSKPCSMALGWRKLIWRVLLLRIILPNLLSFGSLSITCTWSLTSSIPWSYYFQYKCSCVEGLGDSQGQTSCLACYLKSVWMADRLQKCGWPNCGLCLLCKQAMETINHLFVHCRIRPRDWVELDIKEWWSLLVEGASPHRKALASLMLLTVYEIWSERNAQVFNNKLSPSFVILDKIKVEARLWVIEDAKKLGSIILGE